MRRFSARRVGVRVALFCGVRGLVIAVLLVGLFGCHVDPEPGTVAVDAAAVDDSDAMVVTPTSDAADDTGCPPDMVAIDGYCIDRFEAPNRHGEVPLVMYDFNEAEAWCEHRGKRLCFDDEWQQACEGAAHAAYPYGDVRQPGVCNDDKVWRVYSQTLLSGWPLDAARPEIDSLAALFAEATATSAAGANAAQHVDSLYQGEAAGDNPGCTSEYQVFDLTGNVEEWTRRRDGGEPQFHGNLKGRYWAEARTCQSGVKTHGDGFRFYEIGFRCCRDRGSR